MTAVSASKSAPAEPAPEAAPAAAEAPKALVTKRETANLNVGAMIAEAAAKCGKSPVQMMVEFAKLAFGSGKITFDEYFTLGLYKEKPGSPEAQSYVGLKGARDIWRTVNFDKSWYGLFDDKIAIEAMFRGLGFPVPETAAVYSETRKLPAYNVLSSSESLIGFLKDPASYPLFGKPNDSFQSLGSTSLESYDLATGMIKTTLGDSLALEAFAAEIQKHYAAGYLFQKRLVPHKDVRALCGDRAATVRVMTIMTANGPELLRAVWKIPAGRNVADNFWRPGNVLATLDLETGRIVRAVKGTGLKAEVIETHPDSGVKLTGLQVPEWQRTVALALDAQRLLGSLALIGWDIAPADTGPVIVEPNHTPDFALAQIADGRGILDERMKALIAVRKAAQQETAKRNTERASDERTRERQRLMNKRKARAA